MWVNTRSHDHLQPASSLSRRATSIQLARTHPRTPHMCPAHRTGSGRSFQAYVFSKIQPGSMAFLRSPAPLAAAAAAQPEAALSTELQPTLLPEPCTGALGGGCVIRLRVISLWGGGRDLTCSCCAAGVQPFLRVATMTPYVSQSLPSSWLSRLFWFGTHRCLRHIH